MTRVLSALVLLPIVIGTIWFLPPIATLVLAAVAALLAFVEYVSLATALGARVPAALSGAAVIAACIAVGLTPAGLEVVLMSAFVAIAALAVAAGRVDASVLRDVSAAVLPIVYIGMPLGALAAVRLVAGREAVMLLLATIVISDSGQYYCGRAFGRRPLAPAISPKKTVEGAIGGMVLGTVAMVFGARLLFPDSDLVLLAVTAAAVVALGIVGDLFESLLKRSAGVKDSSHLIPGHGGVLDRIDSWLFASPIYYVFVRYLQV
jgi:phosphatidate cytidylyltransferase